MERAGADEIAHSAQKLRKAARDGAWNGPTAGAAPGALQANLAIIPDAFADAFEAYCHLNPLPCPLLARSMAGDRRLPELGGDLDVARDAPMYRVLRNGAAAERVENLEAIWRDDFVAFAIGCSFSFEAAMEQAGVPVRHSRRGTNVPMYASSIETRPSPPFAGPTVVSMRPIRPEKAEAVREICAAFPFAHGAPLHIGDPLEIGVRDVAKPDFGDAPHIEEGEVCAFWACGVTPQLAIRAARLEIAVAHEPGHMLVTDLDAAAPPLSRWAASSQS